MSSYGASHPDVRLHHRARACVGGWSKGGQEGQALGRSRGGFTTKIHAKSDASGDIIAFDLTGGEAFDGRHFETLLGIGPDIQPRVVICDKGYASNANREAARERGIAPVIPHKANEKNKPAFFARVLYKARAAHRAGRRTAQALQAGRPPLRKDQTKLQINRHLRRRPLLDQIRPHGLDAVANELTRHLTWPEHDRDVDAWRSRWRSAFTLSHREVIATAKDLSIRLAELARAIRDRINAALAIETERGPLTQLMKAFQAVLVHDLDANGFADMYAQTIAYGLLSARIANPYKKTADDFAAHMRTNPFLRELMETFLKVGGRRGTAGGPGIDFDELGVSEVVELLDDANMEAVIRNFGDRNPEEDPVIHFYELFLKEYDAKKRMQRGVFYTPRPVVSYIVRSVDELLRTEFGLTDGLADTATWAEMVERHKDLKIPDGIRADQDFVQILDPATGTGTFLVEVIDLIHKTLVAKWKAQGHGEKKVDTFGMRTYRRTS